MAFSRAPRCGSGTARHQRIVAAVVAAVLASVGLVVLSPLRANAATLPSGFTDSVAIKGLSNPMVFRFAVDGRIFVGEKSGLIKVFDNLSDTTPTIFADLRTNVHNFWDRGLMGMELSPQFPTDPSVYVLYTHDAAMGHRRCYVGRLPDTAGSHRRRMRGEWAALPAAGRRQRLHRHGDRAGRGLVPAVPQPLGRGPGLRR